MAFQDLRSRQLSRRELLKWGASVAAASALAACAPAAPAPAPAEAGPAAEAKPAAKAVELRLTFWGDLADMPTWQWGLGEFDKAHPEIKIKWENTPWGEYWTKLQTEVAGGTTPDVVGMVSMYAQQYIRQGTLLSLQPYIDREPDVEVDDFWPAIMPAYQWKNETYAFPYDLSTMLLMYNKNLFEAAGVPLPVGEWTWDQFLDGCMKLTKDGQWGFLLPFFDWTIDAWLSTNKARFISADGLKCLLDSPEAIETIQFLSDLRNKHHVAPTPGEAGDVPLFETGKAAITWGNPEFVQVLTTRVGPPRQNDKFLWDVALIPKKQQNGNALAGGSFAIGKGTKFSEEAWTFVKFYTSAPILREMVGVPSRGIPGRRSVGDSLVTDQNPEHQKFFLDVLDYPAEIMHVLAIPAYQQAIDIMHKYLDQVFLGQMTAAEGMPKVVEELNPVLEKTAAGA
jgi:multiple sugar transport system substrate-binding protein